MKTGLEPYWRNRYKAILTESNCMPSDFDLSAGNLRRTGKLAGSQSPEVGLSQRV